MNSLGLVEAQSQQIPRSGRVFFTVVESSC